ncbi:MAG TPA: hypothetical protein VII11_06760 [Bacteroidota bacterium]
MMRRILTIAVISFGLWSCNDLSVSAVETKPGEKIEVRLQEHKDVLLTPDNVLVTFSDVAQDSRCPSDVVCVWAGMAEIVLKLERPQGGSENDTLRISGLVKTPYRASTIDVFGYRISLLQLDPYPKFEERNEPRVYEALLEIEKL